MLTSLEVYGGPQSGSGTPLVLPLDSDGIATSPFQIRGIDGLEPVKADISTSPSGTTDGENLTGTSLGKRNIVLRLGLNPDWAVQTMEELRQQLYLYFMPKAYTRFRFISSHLPTCEIEGYVESIDPNIFSKEPEVQISIICPYPHLVAITKSIHVGEVSLTTGLGSIDYEGTVSTDVVVQVSANVNRPTYSGLVTIYTAYGILDLEEIFTVDVVGDIDATTYLELSSKPGNRHVHSLLVAGNAFEESYLREVVEGSIWPTLRPGINGFDVAVPTSPGQTWTLSYYAKFGGL